MNGTPTTGELKVKMDNISESVDELKRDVKEGFASLKKDLAENYVSNTKFAPVERFVIGVQYVMSLLLIGFLGLVLSRTIPGFKI